MHMETNMQISLHVLFIVCAKMFIIFLVMHFPNSQNEASVKCKPVACTFSGLLMDLYNCQQNY